MYDVDDYLLKVLNELRRRTAQDAGANGTLDDPTDFQSSTLEELTRRITVEKGLKEEIVRLERGNEELRKQFSDSVAIGVDDNLRQLLEGEISKLKVELETQLKEVQRLVKQRDTVSQEAQETLRLMQQLQASQADLQSQNSRLNNDNARQAVRLCELDDMHLELKEEINRLKHQGLGSQKVPPGQISDTEIKSPGDKQTALLKSEILGFPGTSPKDRHRDDQEVIVLSSDEDEMLVVANRRRLRTRADPIQGAQPISEEKDGNHECRSSDGEGQDELEDDVDREYENAETDFDRRLPIGLPSLGRNIPLSRRIKSAPRNLENLPDLDTTTIFNRHHLNTYLGGALMALQVRIGAGKQKSVAKRFGITSFMCPNLDHNPWAPCHPGQDGYIFVGLGNEEDAFKYQETHELFIQFAPKKMFYAGRYSFQKVDDVTVDEWKCFLPKVKHRYCETTINKTKEIGPVEAVLAAYDEGWLHAPCVFVQFLHFDLPLYKTLSNAGQPVRPTVSTASSSKSHLGEKRKHGSDGKEPVITPRRVKLKGLEPSTPNEMYGSDLGDIYA